MEIMSKPIYLDYNATTPVAPEVAEEMWPYIQAHFENPSSNYPAGQQNKVAIAKARVQVADLIGASPEEIIFTSGGTESNNHAIRGAVFADAQRGNHIITSTVEHPAVTEVCKYLEKRGYEITWLPVDSFGNVDPTDVEEAIRTDTALTTIMHANNEVGTVQAINEIGEIAKKHGVLFHTDAAQSPGKIRTDVKEMGIDLLSIAGHKLYAPKGIGALFIRKGVKLENLVFGAGQERGLRPGTENVAYMVALGKACELAKNEFEINTKHLFQMRHLLLEGLKEKCLTSINLNASLENCLPNTLSIAFEGVDAHTLVASVKSNVSFSTGSACHSDSVEISPVLKAMNIDQKTAAGTVRFSTGKFTTKEEIDSAVEAISSAVNKIYNSK
jgi:cysteine desulfurase